MAKKDLLGGSLWENYSNKVAERMNSPRHLGNITEKEAKALGGHLIIADWGAQSCGDAIRLFWVVDESDVIIKASYLTFGCGTAIASSDMMVELCVGKTVQEAMKITNIDVERALRDDPEVPAVPPQKMHCSVMAYDVIKQAASIYLGIETGSIEEEEMVCECARVSLRMLRDVIRTNKLSTIEEIIHYTKAGGYCKSCIRPGGHEQRKYYIEDILREEIAARESPLREAPFGQCSLFQRGKSIENYLESDIRPMLKNDGGDVEVFDLIESDGTTVVRINFVGACAGCAGATGTTLNAIEEMLREGLDDTIRVEVVNR